MELDEEVAATSVESFIAWMESGPFLFGLEQTTFLMLTIGYGAMILGPWMYFKVKGAPPWLALICSWTAHGS